jgi:hypothetical protein
VLFVVDYLILVVVVFVYYDLHLELLNLLDYLILLVVVVFVHYDQYLELLNLLVLVLLISKDQVA